MSTQRLPLRLIGWSVAVLLLALPVVGLLQGWFASDRWPIRTLEVQAPYRHVSAQAIRMAVMPQVHEGFFATDLGRVQDALKALPWVATASARKRWPDTLVIQVRERKPYAHWNHGELVDHEGHAFAVPDADQTTGLPHLAGPEQRLADVVAFYTKVRGPLAAVGLRVEGVRLDDRGGWSMRFADGARLVVGRKDPDARLQRFLSVYPNMAATHSRHFAYADLRYTNGFAVRWPDAPTPADPGQGASRT